MLGRATLLVSVFAAWAGALAAQAPRTIQLGQSRSDSLTGADPVLRSRRAPYHVWLFRGQRGQRVVIDLTSSDFDPYLVLRDPAGFMVGSDDDSGDELASRLHAVLSRDGDYRIIATAVGESARGRYALAVSGWEIPEAAVAGEAAALRIGETKDGVLEPGDEMSADGPFEDRWTFEARAGARLRVEMRSGDLDSYLTVLGPRGEVLGSDDDGLGDRDAVVAIRAAAGGRYTVLASSYGEEPGVGAYRLTVAEETGDFADPGASAQIAVGETKEGRLESGDAAGERGSEDRWSFQGRAGQVVRIDAISSAFDPYLVLKFGETALESDDDDDGGDGNNARIMTILPNNGTYTAVVSAYTEGRSGGRYTLSLAGMPAPPPAGQSARIAPGQRLAGRLESGDRAREEGGFQDIWEFDGRAAQDVTIELRSAAFDAYLEVRDAEGRMLAENDDGLGDGTDSFIAARLPRAGRYRIAVRGYGEREATGLYELSLALAAAAARPGQLIEVRPGETYMGRLEEGDSLVGDSTYADVYLFRPTRSGEVVISLRSSDFDSYLLLQDASGRTLATDDDGGSGTDSEVTYRVTGGTTYRVLANSYGLDRETGAYRMSLRLRP